MLIWHIDTIGSPQTVDGIAAGLWPLAGMQQELGATVTLFVRSGPDPLGQAQGAESGLEVRVMSRDLRNFRRSTPYVGLRNAPDLVHFHAGWVPYHPALASVLRRRSIPYVVTPHGAYGEAVRASKRQLRAVYERGYEAPYLRGAGALIYNVAGEQRQAESLAGTNRLRRQLTIPFPIDTTTAPGAWSPPPSPTVVFLGRFDVFHKGLDRFVALARLLPHVRFDAYGRGLSGDRVLEDLRASAPGNVRFLPPVFGAAKSAVLCQATMYLQPSRFDGFPLSVADALLHGLPCAVSSELAVTPELVGAGVALALPVETGAAAGLLGPLLDDPSLLGPLSAVGPAFVRERFDPGRSAARHLDLYSEVVTASAARSRR